MKPTRILITLLLTAIFVWGSEVLYFIFQNEIQPKLIIGREERSRNLIEIEHKKVRSELDAEYERKKYLATGSTVFDRVFNTQDQSIIELIRRIAEESLPESWYCDVKAEEFTHFILLIYQPNTFQRPPIEQVLSCLYPIAKYCGDYLSDVAVFDNKHKSYLFFDNHMLAQIRDGKTLSGKQLRLVEEQGAAFTRFNSVTVECMKHESHLLLPIEINGTITCYALFDTGASTTMLSSEIVSETGGEILKNAPRQTFSTVNGTISCPVVTRQVNIGGIRKEISVAVNQLDELNLVGMNFFEGMEYIVDSTNTCIHIWEK